MLTCKIVCLVPLHLAICGTGWPNVGGDYVTQSQRDQFPLSRLGCGPTSENAAGVRQSGPHQWAVCSKVEVKLSVKTWKGRGCPLQLDCLFLFSWPMPYPVCNWLAHLKMAVHFPVLWKPDIHTVSEKEGRGGGVGGAVDLTNVVGECWRGPLSDLRLADSFALHCSHYEVSVAPFILGHPLEEGIFHHSWL